MMLEGISDGDIAQKIGVTRQTVNHWRNRDENFKRVLITERQEVWQAVKSEMSAMYTEALGVLRKHLKSKDPKLQLKAAMQVLNLHDLKAAIIDEDKTTLKVMDIVQQMNRLNAKIEERQMISAAEEKKFKEQTFDEFVKTIDNLPPGTKFRR